MTATLCPLFLARCAVVCPLVTWNFYLRERERERGLFRWYSQYQDSWLYTTWYKQKFIHLIQITFFLVFFFIILKFSNTLVWSTWDKTFLPHYCFVYFVLIKFAFNNFVILATSFDKKSLFETGEIVLSRLKSCLKKYSIAINQHNSVTQRLYCKNHLISLFSFIFQSPMNI